jgi:glycosyltransferase involved in cell wall biosynthesis
MTFQVVIPSARAANLVPCVRALLHHEPDLPPANVIVVDDGARPEAEPQLPGIRWVSGIKPFNFARNVNRGLNAADGDAFVLNDDALLASPRGFSGLAARVYVEDRIGLCSAAVRGAVGNGNQIAQHGSRLRFEPAMLAFVCIFVPRRTREAIGLLDERFSGYGFDDNDYCQRVVRSGQRLAIWDGCVVEHTGRLPSTFRSRHDLMMLFRHNQRLYEDKWHTMQAVQSGSVDLLFLTRNRLDFTVETFTILVANTDWDLVATLFLWDDGSIDGTVEWLRQQQSRVPARVELATTRFGSPVSAMAEWIRRARAPMLAKIDNDTMVPPGWLRQSLAVMDRHPELHFLGIEALYPAVDGDVERSYTPAEWISGLGLYRRQAFARSRPTAFRKYFGLEEWQMRQGRSLVRGWMTPALPLFLLDRMPFEPWLSHSERYVGTGDQRPSQKYDPSCALWHWRWPTAAQDGLAPPYATPTVTAAAAAVTVAKPGARTPAGEPFILGAMRIRNEGAHIGEVISRALEVCPRIVVLDDHSTDDTVHVCRSFGDRVTVIDSPFTGLDEARDKNFLLRELLPARPDWVLWIDGDEVLERRGPQAIRQAVRQSGSVAVYSLRVAYIWDDPNHVRIDGLFGRMARPSLFTLRGQRVETLEFVRTGFGGNLHCGNVPSGLVGATAALEVRLKHLGYVSRALREYKYDWYNSVDPNNVSEDSYRHLIGVPGAIHAPGPVQIVPWVE